MGRRGYWKVKEEALDSAVRKLVWKRLWTCVKMNLLIPWSRVRLEKLTGSQIVKKFPTFYGTRRFITAFTNARHLSLS
jgi:hypothetical protein